VLSQAPPNGSSQYANFYVNADADRDVNGEAHSYASSSHSISHDDAISRTNTFSHTISVVESNSDAHGKPNFYSHFHSYKYTYLNSHCDTDINSYINSYSNAHFNTDIKSHIDSDSITDMEPNADDSWDGVAYFKVVQNGNTATLQGWYDWSYAQCSITSDRITMNHQGNVMSGTYAKGALHWDNGSVWVHWGGLYSISSGEQTTVTQTALSISAVTLARSFTGSVTGLRVSMQGLTGTTADGLITWSNGVTWTWLSS